MTLSSATQLVRPTVPVPASAGDAVGQTHCAGAEGFLQCLPPPELLEWLRE